MDGINVEKLLEAGCEHTFGFVAARIGGAVCLVCLKAALDANTNAAVPNYMAELRAQRDRLAGDALAALADAGIATPEEEILAAPERLKGDIAKLARERDEAVAETITAEKNWDDLRITLNNTDRAFDLEVELVKDLFNRLDKHKSLLADCRTALSQARDMRDTAEKLVGEQRELLVTMKDERDAAKKTAEEERLEAVEMGNQLADFRAKWRMVVDLQKMLGVA